MLNNKALCLIAVFCLTLLIPSCGERGHSRAKDEDADERSATAASAKLPAAMPAFGKPVVYNFDADAGGKPPAHFVFARTGRGTEGTWVVKEDATAPSKPNVLAQVSTDTTDYRFPLAILQEGSFQEVAVSMKFKAVAGNVDRAGGLVFRLKDANNYYVVRANALEDNYRLYRVVAGRRQQFAGANLRVTSKQWHTLRVEVAGSQIKCYYDGELKITASDETFKGPGKVGVWTKADSVIHFDDLTIQDLSPPKSSAAANKTFAQKLVDDLAAKHPEITRIGLHLTPPQGADNIIVASNLPAKIGQKSDPEDLRAMRSGRPVILQEAGSFDVTLPLHDASGKTIGALGLTFKPAPGEQESSTIKRTRDAARELEKQIPSARKLFEPVS